MEVGGPAAFHKKIYLRYIVSFYGYESVPFVKPFTCVGTWEFVLHSSDQNFSYHGEGERRGCVWFSQAMLPSSLSTQMSLRHLMLSISQVHS